MSVYASQLLQHFVRLNQFILILQIMNQHINFIHSGDKNIIDQRVQSVLISDSSLDVNKSDLILGKLPEFSPEYAAATSQGIMVGGQEFLNAQIGGNQAPG